jgi:hypothetical protein
MIRGSTKATNSDGGGSERWELSIEPETFFSTEAVIGSLLERDVKFGLPTTELLNCTKYAPIQPTKSTLSTILDLRFPRPTNYCYTESA